MRFAWRVPADHPAFAGHFPGRPIVPGVVLLDHAILLAQGLLAAPPAAWQVGSAKFLVPTGPGDELIFAFTPRTGGGFAFSVRAGGRDVASGTLTPNAP